MSLCIEGWLQNSYVVEYDLEFLPDPISQVLGFPSYAKLGVEFGTACTLGSHSANGLYSHLPGLPFYLFFSFTEKQEIYLFSCMCMGVLPECPSVFATCMQCLWRPQEGVGSPGTEGTDGCELPHLWKLGREPGAWAGSARALSAGPSS